MPSQERGELSQQAKPGWRKKEGQVKLTFMLTFLIFSAWLAGIFLAPYLQSFSSPWARLVYAAYSPFCHQVPERSLSCFGHPLAVCARCLGIYSGILLGLILYPFIRGWKEVRAPESRVFFSFSAPIVLDTAANFLGVWKSWKRPTSDLTWKTAEVLRGRPAGHGAALGCSPPLLSHHGMGRFPETTPRKDAE